MDNVYNCDMCLKDFCGGHYPKRKINFEYFEARDSGGGLNEPFYVVFAFRGCAVCPKCYQKAKGDKNNRLRAEEHVKRLNDYVAST